MSEAPFYRTDPYLRSATSRVQEITDEGGIVVENSLFYPQGGGQPGDSGRVEWDEGKLAIATTIRAADGRVVLVPAEPAIMPAVGTEIRQVIDWERRYGHMRMHTALHLLSVVIPLPVTGGQIAAEKGRLDFDMPHPPGELAALDRSLNALIARDLPVTEEWITDAELAANPSLVKTMSVAPPKGQGHVRLIRVGERAGEVDLQPCGGTHVARTAEIGPVTISKVENKGRQNRRVTLRFA